ncbi:MAG: YfhO family protein [bacterium]
MNEKIKQLGVLLALCIAVLAPYHRLIQGKEIPIPSDIFISDLADGEFPIRVEAGNIIRSGDLPFWTSNIMTGAPFSIDPLSMILFTAFPPALALGLLYGILLTLTATGTYLLARHLGASRAGAFLSGFSFAWSGFFVCQMRHIGIIGTVAFFPYALYCLEKAVSHLQSDEKNVRPSQTARTLLWLMLFGICFGMQVLAGFPQTIYICSLFYGLLVLFRLGTLAWGRSLKAFLRPAVTLAMGSGGAVLLGTLMGMMLLLPLWELGSVSDRAAGMRFEEATALPYPLSCAITFFCPYYLGDISNLSFTFLKTALFWEVYGYAGMFTLLLACLAMGAGLFRLIRSRKRLDQDVHTQDIKTGPLLFWIMVCLLSFCMVLGPLTPFYRLAFDLLPGFSSFRFPTRFLFVTVLAITLLGGLGLTWLQTVISRFIPSHATQRNRLFVGVLFVGLTIFDLVYHNQRQNPMAESRTWLAVPESAQAIRKQLNPGRVYSPDASNHHKRTVLLAKGWAGDLSPYYLHRNLLQPNSNLLYGFPSLNAYSGLSPRWVVDIIGDHNRYGLLLELRAQHADQAYYQWLQTLSAQWLLFPNPQDSPFLVYKGQPSPVCHLYQLPDSLPRARFAKQLLRIETVEAIKKKMLEGTLDPRATTLLHSEQDFKTVKETLVLWAKTNHVSSLTNALATITVDRATEVVIEADSKQGGFLVLADTYYPGWTATINDAKTPIMRANLMHRGVLVPPGKQTITFRYQPWTLRWGIILSFLGFLSLLSLICYFYQKTKEQPL